MDSPKGKVSCGEGAAMVRILPVRPAGDRSSLGGQEEPQRGRGMALEEHLRLALRSVGWGRLELIDDLVLCGVRLILLHLREQLQRLLLFLCRVVAQEVGCRGQD